MSAIILLFSLFVVPTDPLGEEYKQKALAWAESVHSFSGTYAYRIEKMGNAEGHNEELIEYRFRDEDCWIRAKTLSNAGFGTQKPGDTFTMSRLQNVNNMLVRDKRGFLVELSQKRPFMPSHILSPRTVLGQAPSDMALSTILGTPGYCQTVHSESGLILCYRFSRESDARKAYRRTVNIHFDDKERISKIEYMNRPYCDDDEITKYTGMKPLDVRTLHSVVEYSEWKDFDGIPFPCRVAVSLFDLDTPPEAGILHGKMEDGVISDCEGLTRLMSLQKPILDSIETADFDPGSIRINPVLTDKDLSFEIPANAEILNRETGEIVVPEKKSWLARNSDRLIILGMFLGIILGTFMMWRSTK